MREPYLREKALQFSQVSTDPGLISVRESRNRKARMIRQVLHESGAFSHGSARFLDVGCSFGFMTEFFSSDVDTAVGMDLDFHALSAGKDRSCKSPSFVQADAESLPFADSCFDYAICSHVYEHTMSPERLVGEIYRVLKPDGICYFGAPNRFDVIEPHYRLPLLGWLPPRTADRYVRLSGKGTSYMARPISLPALKRLLIRFQVTDFTPLIVSEPQRYGIESLLPPQSIKHWLAKLVVRYLPFIFPDFVFVLRKASNTPAPGSLAAGSRD